MFGKILVCLHLVLSLLLATAAMVLYTNRVDWTANVGKLPKPDGELVARMAEHKRLTEKVLRPADLKLRANRDQLEQHEAWRPIERPWFDRALKFLKSEATEANPAQQVDRDPTGTPILLPNPKANGPYLQMGPVKDKDGNPFKDRAGNPLALKSLDAYIKEAEALAEQINLANKGIQSAAKREEDATQKLRGPRRLVNEDGKPVEYGLHERIRFEYVKQDRIKDEYEEVRPLLLKTAVEQQNLEQLRKRLEARLKELKSRSRGDELK